MFKFNKLTNCSKCWSEAGLGEVTKATARQACKFLGIIPVVIAPSAAAARQDYSRSQ